MSRNKFASFTSQIIRRIFQHIKSAFANNFVLFKNLVIDESLVLFKGRLLFKQFIRTKRHRFEIKIFLLCESETGFEDLGISGSVLTCLMKLYIEKVHSLFTCNWYISPSLPTYLFMHKLNTCGTVRSNRKQMPDLSGKLEQGETSSKSSDHMLVVRWKDRNKC